MEKDKAVLTKDQWRLLTNVCGHAARSAAKGEPEMIYLSFVVDRTVAFHKFSEFVSTQELVCGRTATFCPPCGLTRWPINKAKQRLERNGLIIVIGKNSYGTEQILLNVPEIIRNTVGWMATAESSASACNQLCLILEKVEAYFAANQWKKEKPVKLKDVPQEAARRSEAARKRRREKLETQELSASRVHQYMEELCAEYNETYFQHWTRKEQGQAKNWLKEMELAGQSPKEVLRDVVRWWFKVHLQIGGPLGIRKIVEWDTFYPHRRSIMRVIVENRETWERQEKTKVVYFDPLAGDPIPD